MRIFSAGSLAFIVAAFGAASCEATQSDVNKVARVVQELPPQTVATIDGTPITEAEMEKGLDGKAKGALIKARSDMYQAKKDALDDYLYKRLANEQAKATGKTYDQLIADQVTGKIKKVTDPEIKAFYEDYKKKGGAAASQMPPLEQVSDRIKQKLEQDRKQERETAYFSELKKKFKVTVEISQPRMEVAVGDNPARGSASAPVTIVMFSDFECPFCKRGEETVLKVLKEYKGKVKIYFRDYPLPFHPKAKPAAVAARCASAQGKFWEYHDQLFIKQELSPEDLNKHAKAIKLDMTKFDTCLKDESVAKSVETDTEAGANAGVNGTPAFFINGIPLSGAQPFEAFKPVIDEELARLKQSGHKV